MFQGCYESEQTDANVVIAKTTFPANFFHPETNCYHMQMKASVECVWGVFVGWRLYSDSIPSFPANFFSPQHSLTPYVNEGVHRRRVWACQNEKLFRLWCKKFFLFFDASVLLAYNINAYVVCLFLPERFYFRLFLIRSTPSHSLLYNSVSIYLLLWRIFLYLVC